MAEHYLVVYYKNGVDENGNQLYSIHAWPGNSIDDCKKKFDEILNNPKWEKRIAEFDIIASEPILQIKRDYARPDKKERKKRSDAGTRKEPKKVEKSAKVDYSKLSKNELKDILAKRGVKTLYHDTMDVLRQKCIESEG